MGSFMAHLYIFRKKISNMEHSCTHKLFGILIGVFTPLLIKKIDKLIVPSTLTSLCV